MIKSYYFYNGLIIRPNLFINKNKIHFLSFNFKILYARGLVFNFFCYYYKFLFKAKILKNAKSEILTYFSNIKNIKKLIFLTFGAKKIFNCYKQAFVKALIL